MRTLTAEQQHVLESSSRSTHLLVEVDRGSGYESLSDLEGRDWVKSVMYGQDLDAPTQTATVTLFKNIYDLSLAPLVDGSKLNQDGVLLDVANPIRIRQATIAQDRLPSASDFVDIFEGEIDKVSWSRDVVLQCRDKGGGNLVDAFIETQRQYGSTPSGDPVEDVIQDILDDNNEFLDTLLFDYTWNGTTTVTTPNTSEVAVGDYIGLPSGSNNAPLFPIASIIPNTSVTITNPSSRTIPTGSGANTSVLIPAARRVTLFSVNGTSGTPFLGSDSPGFNISPYIQSKENIAEAVRELAGLVGYDVKYLFHDNTSAFQLVFSNPLRQIAARGTISLTGQPNAGDTFTVNSTVFTAVVSSPAINEFVIGSSVGQTASNMGVALRTGSEADNLDVFSPIASTDVVIDWGTLGTVGNSIVFTEALTNATADGGGFLGGTRAGSDGPTTPDFTFGPDRYFGISNIDVSREDIRNVVQVTFFDPDDSNERFTVRRQDDASIAKFRRRYMEITEGTASQIDTFEEASTFADLVINDLSEPIANQSVTMPYFWAAQPSDFYRFLANDRHYDTDQDLSVVSIRHSLTRDRTETVVHVRGKPAGGVKRWLKVEGRPGVNPAQDLFDNEAPSNLSILSGIGEVTIEYDDPRTITPPIPDWTITNVHLQLGTADFTANDSNLVQQTRSTRVTISPLTPGADYTVKLAFVDSVGNVGATSTFITQAASEVGAFHQNLDQEWANIIQNGEFTVTSLPAEETTDPPDNWQTVRVSGPNFIADPALWGSGDEVYFTSSQSLTETGNRAIRIDPSLGSSSLPGVQTTNLFPITGDQIHIFEAGLQATNVATSAIVRFRGYEADKSTVAFTITRSGTLPGGANTWHREIVINRIAAAARWFEALAVQDDATAGILYVDRLKTFRAVPSFYVFRQTTTQSIATSTVTKVEFNAEDHDHGSDFDSTTNYEFVCPEDGDYSFTSTITMQQIAASSFVRLRIFVNGSSTIRGPIFYNGSGGSADVIASVSTDSIRLDRDDTVDIRVEHDHGSNRVILTGLGTSNFSGSRIQ